MRIIVLLVGCIIAALSLSCKGTATSVDGADKVAVSTDNTAVNKLSEDANVPATTPMPVPAAEAAKTFVLDGRKYELVLAKNFVAGLVEDLRYATADNFMKRKLYTDPKCYLLRETAERLAEAAADLAGRRTGYRLKVWDCYRPMSVQEEMWKEYTNTPYVANPKTARHPRGRAVDLTIVDADGKEVEMPTEYDDFSRKAHPNAPTTAKAAENRELLRSVMAAAGFTGVNSEWWHFDYLANTPKPMAR